MKVSVISTSFSSIKTWLTEVIRDFYHSGILLYDGSRNTVKRFDNKDVAIVVKGFKPPNIINQIAYRFFRDSKAKRSYTYAKKLQEAGIGTPTPVAYYENYTAFLFKDSYYISTFLDSDLDYRDLIETPNYPDRENILRQFTAFTKKLHDSGILFKDHSPGNTMIKKISDNEYAFYLVDLNRMEFKTLSYEERIKNFTKLTPLKEMVRTMAYTYAELGAYDKEAVFRSMWEQTEAFQQRYHRKRRIKRKVFFWKSKYR